MNTFKERLAESLKGLFSSKKTIITIAGLICFIAAKRGILLNPDDVAGILVFFGGLLGATGLTDLGKGKAVVEAANPKPPEQVNIQQVNPAPAEDVTKPLKPEVKRFDL